jgi:hypothetical protein
VNVRVMEKNGSGASVMGARRRASWGVEIWPWAEPETAATGVKDPDEGDALLGWVIVFSEDSSETDAVSSEEKRGLEDEEDAW